MKIQANAISVVETAKVKVHTIWTIVFLHNTTDETILLDLSYVVASSHFYNPHIKIFIEQIYFYFEDLQFVELLCSSREQTSSIHSLSYPLQIHVFRKAMSSA